MVVAFGSSRWSNIWLTVFNFLKTNGRVSPWQAPSIGRKSSKRRRNSFTKLAPSFRFPNGFCIRNCPGSRSGPPYTSSAAVACGSSLHAARMPSRTIGSTCVHLLLAWYLIAAFRCRWNLSTMPFVCGWYAAVLKWVVPISSFNWRKRYDSNCRPWSVVTRKGVPNRQIHPS